MELSTTVTPGAVTRIARRRAKPGQGKDYEDLIHEMFGLMRAHKGCLGAELFPPEEPDGFYQVVVHFASETALAEWDTSPGRLAMTERLRAVADGEPDYRRLTGLEAWFAPAVVPASLHPPRLRMAIVTWLGIFPTVSVFLWFVAPHLQVLPFLPRTALLTALIVATMTWVVMPRLTRLMRGFLSPASERTSAK